MDKSRIIFGDNRLSLKKLIADGIKVRTVVTSPPYFGLRDYGTGKWEGGNPDCDHKKNPPAFDKIATAKSTIGEYSNTAHSQEGYKDSCKKCGAKRIDLQIGLEATPEKYVENIVEVFRLIWDVLEKDGTVWLNLGDSYMGSWGATSHKMDGKAKRVGSNNRTATSYKHPYLKPKDLIGIPWMVAKALQQPYYTGEIKLEKDRTWLAGLVDGEGCITILKTTSPHGSGNSYPPVLQIRMCDSECIQKAVDITGYGTLSPLQEPLSYEGHRGVYHWRLNGKKATQIISEIYPYLLIKRKQAIVAWNHQKIRESYEAIKGVKIPKDCLEKQVKCRELIRLLNKRQHIDIPYWMEEPQTNLQPGYYLRSDVVWAKPNQLPESVTDRCTKSHEYVFLLTKSRRYYYNANAIKEPYTDSTYARISQNIKNQKGTSRANGGRKTNGPPKALGKYEELTKEGGAGTSFKGHSGYLTKDGKLIGNGMKNKRDVWWISPKPYKGSHTAVFPKELVIPCVLAGSKKGDFVLDPFAGTGTVGEVAKELDRKFILLELNTDCRGQIYKRLGKIIT